MRELHRSLVGVALAASLGVTMARAETATTKEGAHLRQGPSASTELLGELPPRTTLDVLGTSGGWRQVRTPQGTVGYVWAEHLAEEARPSESPRRTSEASSAAPRSVADELHDLRQEVSALAERRPPASAADVEGVRRELERLAAAERDLARRFDERFVGAPASADPAPDWSLWAVTGLVGAGAAIGLFAGRLLQRRRDGGQRSRLRL